MKPDQKPSKETLNEWHNDPSNWKFGIFYFNKNDKRIFPPKRIKSLGWTINFANPISILVIVGSIIMLFILLEHYIS
jgi:uncharacterized membrane protein